jgi:hypothetical protein
MVNALLYQTKYTARTQYLGTYCINQYLRGLFEINTPNYPNKIKTIKL